jgi:hypothetical protein
MGSSMNSSFIRVLFVFVAIAIGASAGYFLKTIETTINGNRVSMDTLRDQGGALVGSLADVRSAQVAYVAQGQGEIFWMERVSRLLPGLEQQAADLKAAIASPKAQADLDPAISSIENFHKLDTRARDYVKSGEPLLASDLIFSDGLEAVGTATTQVQAALNDELRARAAAMAELRMREMMILGSGAGGILLILMILAVTGMAKVPAAEPALNLRQTSESSTSANASGADAGSLAAAAKICTDMARVMESKQLPALLERAAKLLGASGMIVWTGDGSGRELRPALAFGYPDQVMARMGAIPRDATNAAAAAYRAGELRAVNGSGDANGALVAPLMTADGCIGVLSMEMKGGSEKNERSQALASIFAAQLATLVSPPASASLTLAAEA